MIVSSQEWRGEKKTQKQTAEERNSTKQGSYSFFQSQVQGPAEVRPGQVEEVCLVFVATEKFVDPRLLCDSKL